MARYELLLSTVLMLTSRATVFHRNRHPIVTPNNGQLGNLPLSPGNTNEMAMFPPSSSNNLAPGSNDLADIPQGTPQAQLTPTLPTSTKDIPSPDISVDKNIARSVIDTVAPTTVIKVEFPSSITIFVNITNGQSMITPNIGATVQTTAEGTVGTPAVDSSTVEESTSSSSNGTSLVVTEVTTADTSDDSITTATSLSTMTTEGSTVERSTVKVTDQDTLTVNVTIEASTTDMTTGIPTADSSVDPDTTTEVSTTDNIVETAITDSVAETATVNSTNDSTATEGVAEATTIAINVEINNETIAAVESGSLAITTNSESSTESMRHIQININLSDNTQNGNFGTTTQSSVENLGQLQNKMIYKQKCDEYYASSRASRETKVQVFIIGGTSSMPKEFPHMAALGYGQGIKKEWLCGGSLVSENYVVTAAHCVSSNNLGDVQVVRLGTTILNTETLGSMDYKVIKRIPHPNYRKGEQYNDIALLQLDRPVTFSEYVSPICLRPSDQTDKVLIATGWGKTEAAGDVSTELQKVDLEIFPNKNCQDSYSTVSKQQLPRGIVAQIQICAGSRSEQKDTCQGDSGGPLQVEDNGRLYLVGITSFGITCGKPGQPGVYTRVSYYIPWIENIVWGSTK